MKTKHKAPRQHIYAAVFFATASMACAGAKKAAPPPSWFSQAPKSAKMLIFVGDATQQSDEGIARDMAIQKALFNLSLTVGASIESEFKSSESEVNGEGQQSVSLDMSIAGEEISVRGLSIQKVITQESRGGIDAYAMIAWPKEEFQAIIRSQQAAGERALTLFLQAKEAVDARKIAAALRSIKDAQKALPGVQVSLNNASYPDSKILARALEALKSKAKDIAKERSKVCALGVICEKDGKRRRCKNTRKSAMSKSISQAGKKVAASSLSASLTQNILDAETPKLDDANRSAGCLVAVQFSAELLEKSHPFIFINYSARASVYDVASGRIISTHEVEPRKMGHVKYSGAMKKGFDRAQRELAKKLSQALKQGAH